MNNKKIQINAPRFSMKAVCFIIFFPFCHKLSIPMEVKSKRRKIEIPQKLIFS